MLYQDKYRIESSRYKNWDYSNDGLYFVTICTQNKLSLFGKIDNGQIILSEIGKCADKCWKEITSHFHFVTLDEYIIIRGKMKIKDFVFASKVSEACSLLRELGDSAYIIAGGTSTFFISSQSSKVAIDINRVPIKGISRHNDAFGIGAGTTINEIMKYKKPGWVLDRVAFRHVNQQVRNISTIGGNISRVFYWSDFPVALRVLEGTIKLSGATLKTVKISEAFHNATVHKNVFKGSILEYIEIPAITKGRGFGYSKESRTSGAFSAATVAAFAKVDNGIISDIRIAIGAVLPFPVRLFDLEDTLKGKKAECSAIKNLNFDKLNKYSLLPREGMSMDYCKHLLKVKISDVICDALTEAAGGCND